MAVETNIRKVEQRIINRLARLGPKSTSTNIALARVGALVANQAKLNVRTKLKVRTGNLLNSINYRVRTEEGMATVLIGPEGVPYAAIHEFGKRNHRARNAQNLAIPMRGSPAEGLSPRAFPDLFVVRKKDGRAFLARQRSGGRLEVLYTLRKSVNIPKRPYLRPALIRQKNNILGILKKAFTE